MGDNAKEKHSSVIESFQLLAKNEELLAKVNEVFT